MIPIFSRSKLYTGICDVDKTTKGSEPMAEVSTLLCFVRSVVFDRRILLSDLIRVIK